MVHYFPTRTDKTDWDKTREISVKIARLLVEIQTSDFSTMKQLC
jgi:hypothetical protein